MSAVWRQYQQEVAELFRAIGFEATVEETLAGARASHAVDVTVRPRVGGIAVLWIVECKRWKASVRKEQVMTLVQIAQDVGADRAFLLSESGFQAGALTAVRNTNVTLTNLQGLLEAADEDIRRHVLGELASQKTRLEDRLRRHLFDAQGESPDLKAADLDEVTTLLGACFDMDLAITNALAARYPVRLSGLLDDRERVFTNPESLITALQGHMAEASVRAAKLDAATLVRRAQLLDQTSRLAAEIEALADAGDAVFAIPFDGPDRDARLAQSLQRMQVIGALIEELRPSLGPKLFAQVRAVRHGLIDGAYLALSTPASDGVAWSPHAENIRRSARDLRTTLAGVRGAFLVG